MYLFKIIFSTWCDTVFRKYEVSSVLVCLVLQLFYLFYLKCTYTMVFLSTQGFQVLLLKRGFDLIYHNVVSSKRFQNHWHIIRTNKSCYSSVLAILSAVRSGKNPWQYKRIHLITKILLRNWSSDFDTFNLHWTLIPLFMLIVASYGKYRDSRTHHMQPSLLKMFVYLFGTLMLKC